MTTITNTTSEETETGVPRFPDNVPGDFYVNEDCIYCRLCGEVAPDSFRESEEGEHNVVFKQPVGEGEIELAVEAMEGCPVESIVRVGDGAVG